MNIKYFTGCKTLDQLKREYKRLAKIHHPDCGGDDATMSAINAEFDELSKRLPRETAAGETYQPREEEREAPEKFREAVAATLNMDGVTVELCGAWLWVTGNTYPHRERLKGAGYRFSKNKVAWYWHDENSISHSKKRYSLDEIRLMHGSETIKTQGSKLAGAQVGITVA